MQYIPAACADDVLHALLTAYYREGEDADTPAPVLDAFIRDLQGLLHQRILQGDVAVCGGVPVGFVLWALDGEDWPFSECPGLGTIAEIGVIPSRRGQGLGRQLARHAEEALGDAVRQMYVCAHPSARGFWERCGYHHCGQTAQNGLPVCIKDL